MSEAKQFKDPVSGRPVWRCTSVGNRNITLYFHARGWSRDSRWLYFASTRPTSDDPAGARHKLFRLAVPDGVPQRVPGSGLVEGNFSHALAPDDLLLYEQTPSALFRIDSSGSRRQLAEFDPDCEAGCCISVSCDGKLLAKSRVTPLTKKESDYPDKVTYWWSHVMMPDVRDGWLEVYDSADGRRRDILHDRRAFGHVQFSPADSGLLSFCHEGNWCLVQRMWTIRADGTGLRCVRSYPYRREGWGHEFFSADGRAMLGHGYRLREEYVSGRPNWARSDWFIFRQSLSDPQDFQSWPEEKRSVHWNLGAAEDWLVGDGADGAENEAIWRAWIRPGTPRAEFEPLATLQGNAIHSPMAGAARAEPNAQTSPDGKWVAYTSSRESDGPQTWVVKL